MGLNQLRVVWSINKEDPIVPLFIPSLVVILKAAEDRKSSPLTEEVVINISDISTVVTILLTIRDEIWESRVYTDISIENCWWDWCEIRKELIDYDATKTAL